VVFAPGERRGLTKGRRKQVRKVLQSMAIQRINVARRGRTVRQAGITSPGKAVIAAVVRTPLARSVLRRIPGISRLVPGSPSRIAAGERAAGFAASGPVGGTTAIAVRGGSALARIPSVVRTGGKVAAIGGGFALGEEAVKRVVGRSIFDTGRPPEAPRRQPMPRGGSLAVGGELPPSHVVVRTWQTFPGGPIFARLADGHIAVQKKDGTIKHFRPYRPVVIPRKWNARSMSRVATALKRQRKTATKILQITGGIPGRRK